MRRITHPLAWFWIYTTLRVAVFGAIFGLLWIFGVRHLVGAAVALALSVPLSYVILARPRALVAEALHDRLAVHQARTEKLDAQLSGDPAQLSGDPAQLSGDREDGAGKQ